MPSRVRYSTVTVPDAARLRETANSTASSTPSRASASATDKSAGPRTVAVTVFASVRPPSVVTDPAGSVTVTSSNDAGRTAISQRAFCPCAARCAIRTRPFSTWNARSLSSR